MRILHVIASLAPRDGGPPAACFGLARAALARGHGVEIFATDWDGPGRLDVPLGRPIMQQGLPVTYFPAVWPRAWKTSWALHRALQERLAAFDIVHLHGLYLFIDWAVGALVRARGLPYVLQTHGGLLPAVRRRHAPIKRAMDVLFHDRLFADAAVVAFTTERERRLSEPFVRGAPTAVIPLALDEQTAGGDSESAKRELLTRHPELAGRRIVLFLGRLHVVKGLDLLVDAFGDLARSRPEAHLLIAGPDDAGYGRSLRARFEASGLARRVTFAGMLDRAGVNAAFELGTLLALPSRGENFGMSVLEALAAGVPVVISDQVGLADDIAAAAAGMVVPLDRSALAAAMGALFDDAARRGALAARGRALVANRFSLARVAERLEEVYEEALAGSCRAKGSRP